MVYKPSPSFASVRSPTTRCGRVRVHAQGISGFGYLKLGAGDVNTVDIFSPFTDQRHAATCFELTGKRLSFSADGKRYFLAIYWLNGPPNVLVGTNACGYIDVIGAPIHSSDAKVWEVGPDNNVFVVVGRRKLAMVSTMSSRQCSPTFRDRSCLFVYADRDHFIKERGLLDESLLTLIFEDVQDRGFA
ncbi:hypothetical protein FRB99_001200 [Tulasnella sp. 403]|nr:hypothetical protein FRB99_001200 [Tulasnella sp. 403]